MSIFYITPTSISYLAEFILALAISIYLLYRTRQARQQGKLSHNTFLLFATFVSLSTFILLTFLHISLHPDFSLYPMPLLSVPVVISLSFIIQFAYHFPSLKPEYEKEARLVGWLCGLYVVWEILFAVDRYIYLAEGQVIYRLAWMDFPLVLGFLWLSLVFMRQMMRPELDLIVEENPDQSRSVSVWQRLCRPEGREIKSTRAFFLFSLIPFVLALNMLARSYGLTSIAFSEIVLALGTLFLLMAFTLVYLNYLPEKSSFIVKLAGIMLTTTLAILGVVAWLISPAYIEAYQSDNIIEEKTSLRFTPNAQGGYDLSKVAFSFDQELGEKWRAKFNPVTLDFDFPFYDKFWREIYIREDGIVSFGEFPNWSNMRDRYGVLPAIFPLAAELDGVNAEAITENSGIFIRKTENKMIISWHKIPETYAPDRYYTFQLIIQKNGVVSIHYAELPEKHNYNIATANSTVWLMGLTPGGNKRNIQRAHFKHDLPLTVKTQTAIIDDYYLDFRGYLNRIFATLAYFILGSAFLTLISFPVLFRHSLVRPLENLLQGVQQFRAGRLDTSLPVEYHDEIGYLTQSFNAMAAEQQNLIVNLEQRVAERTAEVADYTAKNARFEERNRLSRDLHDAVSQTLFSAVLMTENLPEIWKQNPKQGKEILGELRALNQHALSEMRILLLELRSQAFTEESLGSLIRQLSKSVLASSNLEVNLDVESDCILPVDVQNVFYRIAQESFNNINKHANANTVNLYFDCLSEQAMLSISDNGRGFLADNMGANHLGLKIMQERVATIGATLDVQSQPDQGTHITLVWNKQDAK